MMYPDFYDAAPRIILDDPLSEFLGAAGGGALEYAYLDAVKLAGHSCPTVAGAYLMTIRALEYLYADRHPERGAIEVSLRDPVDAGTAGVMAAVAGLLTGAAAEGGFKGIAGRFVRRGLLQFGQPIEGEIGYRRCDTGSGVQAYFQAAKVPSDPLMPPLLQRMAAGAASDEDAARFRSLWQDRVRRILIDYADDPGLIRLEPWNEEARTRTP